MHPICHFLSLSKLAGQKERAAVTVWKGREGEGYLGFTVILPLLADEGETRALLHRFQQVMGIIHQEQGRQCLHQARLRKGAKQTWPSDSMQCLTLTV